MTKPKCPTCDAEVTLDGKPVLGEILQCADCGTELEVTSLDPVAVDKAPEMQEDWGE